MKFYKQPTKSYFVLAFDKFNFRFGYTRPWHIAIRKYRGMTTDIYTLWLFGIFLRIDTDKRNSDEVRRNRQTVMRFRHLLEEELEED